MGRHAAADGAAAHPLVAAALARRSPEVQGAHRPGSPGPIGWPGTPPGEGGGLGWPGDLPAESSGNGRAESGNGRVEAGDESQAGDDEDADSPDDGSAPVVAPQGWRRLLGRRPAA